MHRAGAEVAIVVGGGNFWRSRSSGKWIVPGADHMGMLGTVINALALADALSSWKCRWVIDRYRNAASGRAVCAEAARCAI